MLVADPCVSCKGYAARSATKEKHDRRWLDFRLSQARAAMGEGLASQASMEKASPRGSHILYTCGVPHCDHRLRVYQVLVHAGIPDHLRSQLWQELCGASVCLLARGLIVAPRGITPLCLVVLPTTRIVFLVECTEAGLKGDHLSWC